MSDHEDELVDIEHPFESNEEEAIVALVLDSPEFFTQVGNFLTPDLFKRPDTQYVMSVVSELYDAHEVLPPKPLIKDAVLKSLDTDSDYEPVFALLDRDADPREAPHIKETILNWSKDRAYGLLFNDGYDAYARKEYDKVDAILDRAQRITDMGASGMWFFDNLELLFHKEARQHFSSGFEALDLHISPDSSGMGPCRREVLCWMAPTGVGKSLILVNTGERCILDGFNVLHITLETSQVNIMLRYAGVISGVPIIDRMRQKTKVEDKIAAFKRSTKGNLFIAEYPPDEISVDHIYQLVDWLKKSKGWKPDVIIIDYLELMTSRHKSVNSESEYIKQKRVSTEIRGLASKEDCMVVTATQTNRPGDSDSKSQDGKNKSSGENIGLSKAAESYGKLMPMDYVVSINQTSEEYNEGRARLYIAKNRNGAKFKTIPISISYDTMKAKVERPVSTSIDG